MNKGCQRLAVFVDLNAHWRDVSEQLKRPRVVHEMHALISLHSFFAREPFIFRKFDPGSSPNERFDSKARTGTNRGSHVVRELRVNQYDSWRTQHMGLRHRFKQDGQGTGGHGRAFAQEDSNLTARRLFLPEKYPSPITTD